MRIGEFAKICDTKISVLRHYDKQGLLVPAYIDQFTGYRYYQAEQIVIFMYISALKKADFSLNEIKNIITNIKNTKDVLDVIEKKKADLNLILVNLEEAKKIMLGADEMINIIFKESENGIQAISTIIDGNEFNKVCQILENAISSQDYQRISNYTAYGEQLSKDIRVACDVIKLKNEMTELKEDINLPFVNDEAVIGKWSIVGEYAVKQDFFADVFCNQGCYGETIKEIYFLPNGEHYWCYGWTKGKLLIDSGDGSSANLYETEDYNGERYMFVDLKSYYYRRGGKSTVLVLRQLDHIKYSSDEISRKDNIDFPFVDDKNVIGKWKAHSFCRTKEMFSPDNSNSGSCYFSHIEFIKNGGCISQYGDEIIEGDNMQVWTKGYVLRKWNESACAYEIEKINGIDYLIIEWKSGDYRWGGFDTNYYVFVRE